MNAPATSQLARPAVAALRPEEWVKNLFVYAAVLFSGSFDLESALEATAAFASLCAVSSAGYLVNDIRDAEQDRRHPTKRERPIASGRLPVGRARGLALLLAVAGLGAAFAAGWEVAAVVAGYGALTLAYSYGLKRVVIVDVMTIAGCFLLRVIAGAVAVDVEASEWLLVCTGMVSLFLGFTKRRQEALLEAETQFGARPVLEHYSLPFLDQMVAMVTAGTIISYTIYATESPIVGDRMLATVPMVVYGVSRYLYLIYHREDHRSTARMVTSDPGIVAAALVWAVTAALVVYL